MIDSADSPSRDGLHDNSVYILIVFPGVVFTISSTLIVILFWRHDLFLFLRISLVRIILQFCMYIELESDDSYINGSGSFCLYTSDTPSSSSFSEDSDRDKSVTPH